ncbi:hypothetical protein D3C75_746210 [compost metagenome]
MLVQMRALSKSCSGAGKDVPDRSDQLLFRHRIFLYDYPCELIASLAEIPEHIKQPLAPIPVMK